MTNGASAIAAAISNRRFTVISSKTPLRPFDISAAGHDIDIDRIGLFGNSESGWFTPEIAYRTDNIAFIFNRVGPPLPWIDTVLWEVRNEFLEAGVAESDLDKLLDVTGRQMEPTILKPDFDPALADSPRAGCD